MEKYDTSQLTEFPRFESEPSQRGVTTFFNKFLKLPLFSPSESTGSDDDKSLNVNKQTESAPDNQEEYNESSETGNYIEYGDARSFPNVIKRISGLVALGQTNNKKEPCEVRSTSKDIHDVFRQLSFALPTKQHRYRLVRYDSVWRGSDVMQWLVEHTPNRTSSSLVESGSSYCLNLDLDTSSARLIKSTNRGIALALGVRDKALRRTARCTKADLVASIDARIGTPRLGTCKNFYVKNYSSKTLMVFEGCAEPNLGCSIILRGGTNQELARVKKVVKFMLLACYNWRLEKAFLTDIEATLPEPGMSFEDDEESEKNEVCVGEANLEVDTKIAKESDDIFGNTVSNELLSHVDVTENELKTDRNLESTCEVKNQSETNRPVEDESEIAAEDILTTDLNVELDVELSVSADDPLEKKPFVRKADSDKNPSCGVPIRDFSDPLRSTLSVDDEVFLPQVELKADIKNERWCTDDVLLSMSPNIVIPAPERPLPRARPAPGVTSPAPPATPRASPAPRLKEPHPFVQQPVTAPADDVSVRRLLAHFRATGCQIVADTHKVECPRYKPSVVHTATAESQLPQQPPASCEPFDPLSPEHHQTLNLLIYSYSNKSPNVPDFCVNPWIATMEMYGRHDITLGAFLEKYCFNGDQKCPAPNCPVPMNQHVRNSVDKPRDTNNRQVTGRLSEPLDTRFISRNVPPSPQVMFWSRCESCGRVSHGGRMSRAALCLSLAQYVRWRARAVRYTRRSCPHPLHTHSHAFLSGLTTACFRCQVSHIQHSLVDRSLACTGIADHEDGLVCRVYYALQFDRLRHAVLAPLGPAPDQCCHPHTDNDARIVGVFSVGGAGVLVTEHVWYGEREPDARFDLKGASRQRLALGAAHLPPSAAVLRLALGAAHLPPSAAVLVDDNLLALRWERQLYVSSGVCAGLWRALERDTTFLAEHHVMDYSLLLGTRRQTLVLGIIDYIRTFTWDKKLEHLVKKNLGSGQPTVVSPHQYQRRFCAACRKYFLECPSHWDHLYDETDA
ncbi:unnamed protein product [Leptidea sinapis]|uniref:1-phosphatidylinositol-3-phosphate 5-kinase n=1 Tax=Leptidea sinapis TaxID=189913 RepID=A0A5E4QH66_9NEOP|nr:unnamed protein product [Leptidea sinapis]